MVYLDKNRKIIKIIKFDGRTEHITLQEALQRDKEQLINSYTDNEKPKKKKKQKNTQNKQKKPIKEHSKKAQMFIELTIS